MVQHDPTSLLALRRRLVRRAQRFVTCASEAEDLANDALLAAHQRGRDLTDPATERWLGGVLWRRAAFLRRTAARQRHREASVVDTQVTTPAEPRQPPERPTLPPSLGIVARLADAGCTRDDIQWVLDLPATAMRQRICALRRRLHGSEPAPESASPVEAGPVRQAVLPHARRTGQLGAHDPDGHPILVVAHKSGPVGNPG